jgi:hypothetical protein
VNSKTVWPGAHAGDYRSVQDRASRSDQSVRGTARPLVRVAGIIVALLLSLGLWWVIWRAISSFATAWL